MAEIVSVSTEQQPSDHEASERIISLRATTGFNNCQEGSQSIWTPGINFLLALWPLAQEEKCEQWACFSYIMREILKAILNI